MSERSPGPHQIQIPFFSRVAPGVGLAMFVLGIVARARTSGRSEFSGIAAFMLFLWISGPGPGLFVDSLLFRLNVRLCEDGRPDVRSGGRRLALALAVVNFFCGGALLLVSLLWAAGPLLRWTQRGPGSSETSVAGLVGFSASLFFFGYPVLLVVVCAYFGVRFIQLDRGGLQRREEVAPKTLQTHPAAPHAGNPKGSLKDQAEALRQKNLARRNRVWDRGLSSAVETARRASAVYFRRTSSRSNRWRNER